LGIYAVISYSVSQRTTELGLVGIGMLLGSSAAWLLAPALASLLFGVTFTDPLTFLGMMLILTAAAGVAGYLPALGASKIEPIAALRTS
jgi:ABC-type antimicrobial peptide transport system permease subunit